MPESCGKEKHLWIFCLSRF